MDDFRRISTLHEFMINKKVLLRERKRHTARCVTSTCFTVPVGVTPASILTWDLTYLGWGTPILTSDGGTPPPSSPGILVSPLVLTWDGDIPPVQTWDWGTPHQKGWGYPCPYRGVNWQTENSIFPHPSDAGGNKYWRKKYEVLLIPGWAAHMCSM